MAGRRGRAWPRAPGALPCGGVSVEEQSPNLWMGGCWLMGLRNSCGLVSPLTCHNDIFNTFFVGGHQLCCWLASPHHTSNTAHGMCLRTPPQSVRPRRGSAQDQLPIRARATAERSGYVRAMGPTPERRVRLSRRGRQRRARRPRNSRTPIPAAYPTRTRCRRWPIGRLFVPCRLRAVAAAAAGVGVAPPRPSAGLERLPLGEEQSQVGDGKEQSG